MHSSTKTEIIDVHSHIYPGSYLDHLESRQSIPRVVRRGNERLFAIFPEEVAVGGDGGRPMGREFWSLEEKLTYMQTNGIDRTVVSLGNPWLNPMPDRIGDELARAVNLELAELGAISDGKIIAMGALPAGSVEAVCAELRFIAGEGGLVGVSAGPKVAGLTLDDARLDPFWTELTRLDLPLFIHPENGIGTAELSGYGHALPIGVAFPMETTVAVTRLIFGAVLERFPHLRLLLAHGGGTLPFLAGRLDAVWRSDPSLQSKLPKTPSAYLPSLYYDGLLYDDAALQTLVRLAGTDHVLFGTDHPFSVADPLCNIQAVEAEFKDTAALGRIFSGSARDLFRI